MTSPTSLLSAACLAAVSILLPLSSYGQSSISEAGRAILEKNKPAIVTVSLTITIKASFPGMGSQEQEDKSEVTGTIVDPSGVAIVSLSSADPTFLMKRMREMDEGSIDSAITAAKYILHDGTEVEAKIVLRDPELDLAFFRPAEEPAAPMAFIDLSDAGDAQILDQLIVINRLGRVTNRSYSASVEWVESTMERPRKFYIPGEQNTRSGLGCPAFTTDGKVLGMLLLRAIRTGGGRGNAGDSMTSVILPASEIAELVDEAKSAAPIIEELPPSEEAPAEEGADDTVEPAPAPGV